jgi:hypothetical protein
LNKSFAMEPRQQLESHVNCKILIMGLPGTGKTTLALTLAPMLKAVLFNADAVRANINQGLVYSLEDRIEHARRMGWLCDRVVEAGHAAIADFVCPTPETRAAFGNAFVVFVDRIQKGRFEDTNRLFVPPATYDLRIEPEGTPRYWAQVIFARLRLNPRVNLHQERAGARDGI